MTAGLGRGSRLLSLVLKRLRSSRLTGLLPNPFLPAGHSFPTIRGEARVLPLPSALVVATRGPGIIKSLNMFRENGVSAICA